MRHLLIVPQHQTPGSSIWKCKFGQNLEYLSLKNQISKHQLSWFQNWDNKWNVQKYWMFWKTVMRKWMALELKWMNLYTNKTHRISCHNTKTAEILSSPSYTLFYRLIKSTHNDPSLPEITFTTSSSPWAPLLLSSTTW